MLARVLPGDRLQQRRHRLKPIAGIVMSVDEFEGALAGLTMVEAEFETDELMASFSTRLSPSREVTDDPRYSGVSPGEEGAARLGLELHPSQEVALSERHALHAKDVVRRRRMEEEVRRREGL